MRFVRLNHKVLSAAWDVERQVYDITVQDLATGIRTSSTAEIIISAAGIFHAPKLPDIPGLSTFEGRVFHTAEWDKDLDMRGKSMAVIGNGATA